MSPTEVFQLIPPIIALIMVAFISTYTLISLPTIALWTVGFVAVRRRMAPAAEVTASGART